MNAAVLVRSGKWNGGIPIPQFSLYHIIYETSNVFTWYLGVTSEAK